MSVEPVDPAALYRRCDPGQFPFRTTADLEELTHIVGQDRAVEAVEFAVGIRRQGYNLYALGPEGIGKETVIRAYLSRRAAQEPVPRDWCYVNNFADPQRPRALRLPPGRGVALREEMERLTLELRSTIPAAFESDDYRSHKEALEEEFKARRDQAVSEVDRLAEQLGIAVIRTPLGTGLAPVHDGRVLESEEIKALPPEEQERLKQSMKAVEERLDELLRRLPRWEREHREQLRELNRDVTRRAVEHLIDELQKRYADLDDVVAYFGAVQQDVIDNVADFLVAAVQGEGALPVMLRRGGPEAPSFRRYEVNVLVDHSRSTGAPVVYEDNPTHANLIGRIEHTAQLGALVTDFTLIRPGALHRANGGYVVLEARNVLQAPFAWEALKRALRSREIRIESLGQALSPISTVSLEPEPIPLDAKVALVGDRLLYYLLCEFDPDFLELFKVQADFEERVDRSPEADLLYARLMGTLAHKEELRPLDVGAVARAIEYAARLADDAEKLSTHMRSLSDLLREADHWAGRNGHETLTAHDIQQAIDARIRRASRLRERIHEEVRRGTILIDTAGASPGQINGLTVTQVGDYSFGWPTRITARVRLGRGEVVDVEREVELGGPIHSKGVMILAGFLGGRYGTDRPLTLQASLVFEQSYGAVEGDSASLAELCALLSALGDVPIRQSLAVTGSVNQLGAVQAIGGVNDKIEGFFDVCASRGLTGEEGVIVPAANVKHLMLRRDVVEAAEAGRFHVYAVETVDEALELLTGRPAGVRDALGAYPPATVNARVESRLIAMAERAREFVAAGRELEE